MKRISPVFLAAAAAVAASGSASFAEGSPWLPAPGAGSITVSYVSQEATEFYRAARKGPTPAGGHELGQQTLWVAGTHGLSDSLALDFRVGGAELSVLIGKYVGERGALSAELGYRYRNGNIPADTFMDLSAGVLVGNRVGLNIGYRMVDAESSGLDIGVPPFSPDRFPELQEEVQLVIGTISFGLSDTTNLGLSYGSVVGGRNTAVSDVIGVTLSFNFDTY